MIISMVSLSIASVASANLVANGDFETGVLVPWHHSAGVAVVSDNGPSAPGSYAAEILSGNDLRSPGIAASEGDTFKVSYDYAVTVGTGSQNAGGWFRYFKADGGFISEDWHGDYSTDGAWATESFTSVAPAGTAHVDIQFRVQGSDLMLVDNVSVIPEPTTLSMVGMVGAALMVIRKKFTI